MNTPVVPKASPETLPELATYLGALRAALPPFDQPGECGALPHGLADRPAAQEL